jgi:MFS family permease
LIGSGAAFGWIGTLSLVAIWFPPHKFALVAGITGMIGMIGAIGGQAPLAMVVAAAGWRATLVGAAIFGAVLAGGLWWIVRDKEQPAGQPAPVREPLWPGVVEVATNANVWAVGLIVATVSVPLLVFAGLWGVPYMMEAYGMGRTEAAVATSMILVGWGIGAPLFGWFSDRVRSRKKPQLVGATLAFLAILCVIYVPGLPQWLAFVLLFLNGFFGSSAVISYAACRESCRTAVSGTSMGFVNTQSMGLSAIFQPLVGWFLDLGWSGQVVDGARVYSVGTYRMAFLSLAACGVVAVVAAALARETHGLATVRRRPLESSGGRD